MTQNKNELDVDFIGGLEPLTKEEEKAISEFIKASKESRKKYRYLQRERIPNKSVAVNKAAR